jgi:hypothetical protein
MRITSAGNVGIGTASPGARFHVKDSSAANDNHVLRIESFRPNIVLSDDSSSTNDWQIHADSGILAFITGDATTNTKLTTERMRIASTGNVGIGTTNPTFTLDVNGSFRATSITESSSIVLKENVRPIEDSLSFIKKLNGVVYDRKDGSSKDEAGLIAEEVYKVLPNLVSIVDGAPEAIQYTKLTAYLIEAVKSLMTEIDELKKQR